MRKDFSDEATMTESRGVEGVKDRVAEERDEVRRLEKRLAKVRGRRNQLVLKLGAAGLSERVIGDLAGISGHYVHMLLTTQILKRRGPSISTQPAPETKERDV